MGYRGSVGGYRGRKTGHDILKTVVVVLAVLAVVLIGITLLGSDSLMEKLAILSPQKSVSQQEEPQKEEVSENFEIEQEEQQEPEKLFDPETEEIFEILWNSEKPSEEVSKGGHAFYGAEECYGYENLLAFAEKYPEH